MATEGTVAERLAALRGRLSSLEWDSAAPGAETAAGDAARELRRQIERLEYYETRGFIFEPDF